MSNVSGAGMIQLRLGCLPSEQKGSFICSAGGIFRALEPSLASRRLSQRLRSSNTRREPCRMAESMNITRIIGKANPVASAEQALRLAAQFLLLIAVSQRADMAVAAMHLPVPSNAVGMLALFLLLQYRVLHLEQVNAGAVLLVRHLAFFFIPIAVGLMAYRELLATTGLAMLLVIAASALVGMLAAGLVVQLVKRLRP
jgi:holin-like protein